MTRDEVKKAMGDPMMMYVVGGEETWVYSSDSVPVALAKETSLNMVPVAGPLVSLLGKVSPKPEQAKAEVTFNAKGKASRIRETKETTKATERSN